MGSVGLGQWELRKCPANQSSGLERDLLAPANENSGVGWDLLAVANSSLTHGWPIEAQDEGGIC